MLKIKPVVLAIIDGWGIAPDGDGNAITRAKLPIFSRLIKEYPVMTLSASGSEVGLSFGEMGNSEVGHLNIGAGRVYYQSLPRINRDIQAGSFFENSAFLSAAEQVKNKKSNLHLIGLLSNGNVHASLTHCFALLEFAKKQKIKKVFVHVFLDGRDSLFNSGIDFVKMLLDKMKELKVGQIASICGRFYAMDRDNRWDRTEKAYSAIACGTADEYFTDPIEAIQTAYNKKVYDEEFNPVVIGKQGKPTAVVGSDDAVIFFNYRPDRARQLTKAFVLPAFNKFKCSYFKDLMFVTMTEYEKELPVVVAFPPQIVQNCLAETISNEKVKQFHIAETEKYAHITFFLNGTFEEPFPGEDRKIISSPKVSSYDQAPEMSASEITKGVIKAVEDGKYGAIMMNFANADMVGHTGNKSATIKACETIDRCLGQVVDHVLAKDGVIIITADHGNAEEVTNLQTGEIDKEHSNNPVPLIIISNKLKGQAGPAGDPPEGDLSLMHPVGMLADVAPTMLKIMGIKQPKEMTGRALI